MPRFPLQTPRFSLPNRQPLRGRFARVALASAAAAAVLPTARTTSAEPAGRPAVATTTTAAGPATRGSDLDGDWAVMRGIEPRGYLCGRAPSPVTIDGRGDEPAWAAAAWTEDFADIQGVVGRPAPRLRTRVKMLWDDDAMYVLAELEEPDVWASITKRNTAIYLDNAFEVFLDPDGDRQNYYEFEVNALNTTWQLSLSKPYRDGGKPTDPAELPGLRSAVHVDGTLNAPAGGPDRGWSVEVAMPWAALRPYAGGRPCPPADGQQWRANFSRVQWGLEVVDGAYRKVPREVRPAAFSMWSPIGVVDTHRPERWGTIQFSASPATATFRPDPLRPARDAVMGAYYRQRAFKQAAGGYARSAAELGLDDPAAGGLAVPVEVIAADGGYTAAARVSLPDGTARIVRLRDGSRLTEE
ncbi:MAG: hypothetical protein JWO31_4042 [Phycisphaerales bacterium]|nr:hypothetical protein [Phycisphaerales bacterium]